MDANDWAGFYAFSVSTENNFQQLKQEYERLQNMVTQQTQDITNLKKEITDLKSVKQ